MTQPTFANLTSWGETNTNPQTSASITVPNGSALIISWTGSQTAPNQDSNAAITSAPSGMNFTQLARVANGRRCTYVWIAVNTSGNDITGTYEITQQPTGGGTANGHMAIFDRVNNVNTTTPNGTVQTVATSGTSISTGSVGSPTSNDAVFGVGTSQLSGAGMSLEASFTVLAGLYSGTNVRQMVSGYDTSDPLDDTLTVNIGGSSAGSGVAFIVYGTAGGGSQPPLPHVAGFGPDRYGPMTVLRM